MVPDNPLTGPVMMYIGGSGLGASSAGVGGGSGGLPVPMVDLTLYDVIETIDLVSDAADAFDGLGNLSYAAEYGIKEYYLLKKELRGTGLQAHHIVEVRFLNGQQINIDKRTALSVAVTRQEHQWFTNEWRDIYEYGQTPYDNLGPTDIWEAAKKVYRDYPELIEAVRRTLF